MTSDQGSTGPADETAPLPVGEQARQAVEEQARQANANPPSPGPASPGSASPGPSPRPSSPPPSSPPPGYEPSGSPGVLRTTSEPGGAEKVTGGPSGAAAPEDTGPGAADEAVATGSEADRIRQEIEETRADLGDTVDALSAKLDVKGRVEEKRAEVTETVKEKANEGVAVAKETVAKVQEAATDDQGKPTPPAIGAAAGFLFVLVLFLRRRRKKRRAQAG